MNQHKAEKDAIANVLRSLADDTPELARAAQNHLIAQRDYMGQGLEFLVNPWAETLRTIADGLCPILPEPTCDLPFGDGYTCDLPKGHA